MSANASSHPQHSDPAISVQQGAASPAAQHPQQTLGHVTHPSSDHAARTEQPRRRGPFGRARSDEPRARFSQLWPYLIERKGILITAAVLSVVGALLTLCQPLLLNVLITRVQNGEVLGSLVWLVVALLIAAGVITGVQYYVLSRTGEGVVLSSRQRLVHKILRLPISEIDQRRTGDLVSRVSSDTTLLRAVLTQGLVDAVGGVFILVGAIVGMLVLDPLLFALTALVLVVAIVAVSLVARQVQSATREAQKSVGALTAAVERSVRAVRTIRANGATARETAGILTDAHQAYDRGLRIARLSALVGPTVQVALQAAVIVVLGVGGLRVAAGVITIAQLVSFVIFLFMMVMPLASAAGAFTSVQSALGALARIQEVLDLPDEDAHDRVRPGSRELSSDGAQPTDTTATAAHTSSVSAAVPTGAAIALDQVTFRYPSSAEDVLQSLSFSVAPGTKTALVGPSGAGKSTVLGLLERFYDVQSGTVQVDGVDVRSWDRDLLRAQFGYVEQDSPVLAGSLGDNLRLAAPDATDEECLTVLREVNLEHLVSRDDAGLDASVGEGGSLLSGGERQRLALARVLLAGPPILLLDELTSSLDGLNEELLKQAIAHVAAERTLVVIAHRLSTVIDSDQIVVMQNGKAVATGTHEQLLAMSPLYRELAEQQLLA
ncbi:ABC transporter ATP-binding protein [Pseudoclavibacter sp. CFCC 13796]|uniref:ABC transporter ATP-binding protein n=1 Tax=Pseudoclavibacter sp. CFCC 13796 TaxID=2615179 RepID=UPI0013015906|nr:ABC transporter ATP-binding protein [Pseudoclavibacter sp. CFCC 13796]KAB1659870.1 ABC transporter ATP-binding protein [Pseudoclavibacter sp. CFCC 13796]